MSEAKQLTDNEVIAAFMGVKYEKDPFVKSMKPYWHYKELNVMAESLSFDTSWDWLMPVVEKIEKLRVPDDGIGPTDEDGREYVVTIDSGITIISENGENPVTEVQGYDTRIENTYHCIVRFIKEYSTLNPDKP